jgi:hypothetical protein
MALVKRELFVLIHIVASFVSAIALVLITSSLSGESLLENTNEIKTLGNLNRSIRAELDMGIQKRLDLLGKVPQDSASQKSYCAELAKGINALSNLTERQRMVFDSYNVRRFDAQLKRMLAFTETSDVRSLMDELEMVKRELKNSANLIDKRISRLSRQRAAYVMLFLIFWGVLYSLYSRGNLFKKSNAGSSGGGNDLSGHQKADPRR